jgi:ABC-2 type transport system permease protein
MNYLHILLTYIRLGILGELEYRMNFLLQFFESLMGLGVALGGLAVVFSHTDTLGGWLPDHLLALVGIHLLVGGVINLVISPSMQRFMEDVRKGTLDFTIIKPEDAQFLVSIQRIEVWKAIDIGLGLFILGTAAWRMGASIGLLESIYFSLAMLLGGIIVYCFYLLLATCSFWFVRVENILVIFQSMYVAGRWPVGIYPHWLRFALTFLVPVAFAVTVPAEGLVGRPNASSLIGALFAAAVLFVGSRIFWNLGVRHYSGASA